MSKRTHLSATDEQVRSASPGVIYRQRARRTTPLDEGTQFLLGVSLILGSLLLLVCGIYAVLISSHMPDTGYTLLDAVKYDEHYKYLIPLLVPAGLVAVIVNWGGLHYFRHA